jgi:hypothetical protein
MDGQTTASGQIDDPLLRELGEPEAGLFGSVDDLDWWREYWKAMPEFNQEDLQAVKSITVNFATEADLRAFGKLVGQPVKTTTRSIWFPEAEIWRLADKRYTDAPAWRRTGR